MENYLIQKLSVITDEEKAILNGKTTIDRNIYMDSTSSIINAKKLLEYGKLITMRPHTRFVHFPTHTHDYIEMIYVCSGSVTHVVNDNRITVSKGEIIILNQYAKHEILPASQNDIAVNFIILPQFFEKSLEMLGEEETPLKRFVIDCIAGQENIDGYLYFKTHNVLPIENLIENLIYTFLNDTQNKRKINEFTLGLLLLQLINHSDTLANEHLENNVILSVLKYIETNYQNASLTELSKALHYDVYWLSRQIKLKTSKTYTELLQEKRLAQAAFLLSNTNIKVSDIAIMVGYNNLSYFHRIFEKHFKKKPKKYRDNA